MVCCKQRPHLPALLAVATIVQLLCIPEMANAQTIYRCPQLNGPPLFSGTSCASAHQLEPALTNRYAPPPLTTAEQQQLASLRQKANRRDAQQQRTPRNPSTSTSSDCARHQEALHALQSRRRKGYKLSEAARLEQQEQGLRQNIRLHC